MNDFLSLIAQLKRVRRTGWVLEGVPDAESVADHSWGMLLLLMLAFEHHDPEVDGPLDRERAMRLAVVHDLQEAITGDLVVGKSPLDLTKEEKRRREDEAEQKILALGGPSDLAALWDEYREGTTLEARLVKDCDRLEMGLQAVGYREVGELSVEGAAAFLTEDADYQTAMVRALLGR